MPRGVGVRLSPPALKNAPQYEGLFCFLKTATHNAMEGKSHKEDVERNFKKLHKQKRKK